MINHREFEKISGPIATSLKKIFGGLLESSEAAILKERATTITKSKAQEKLEDRKKYAKLQSMPKVDKSGIARAKKTTVDDDEGHSVRRAIERSKNPKKVLTEVKKSTEPIYAGGNTASNMRGVIRSQEKKHREDMKKRFGKHSRVPKKSFY